MKYRPCQKKGVNKFPANASVSNMLWVNHRLACSDTSILLNSREGSVFLSQKSVSAGTTYLFTMEAILLCFPLSDNFSKEIKKKIGSSA